MWRGGSWIDGNDSFGVEGSASTVIHQSGTTVIIGDAKGSLERSIELARAHLDFFAFTRHASWHDMPQMPGDRHMVWVNGFKVHADH